MDIKQQHGVKQGHKKRTKDNSIDNRTSKIIEFPKRAQERC